MKLLPKKQVSEQIGEQKQRDLKNATSLKEAISEAERDLNKINDAIAEAERKFAKLAPDKKLLEERNAVESEVVRLRLEREVLLTPVKELVKEAEEKKAFWNNELKKLDKKEIEVNKKSVHVKALEEEVKQKKQQIDEDLAEVSNKRKEVNKYESNIKEKEAALNTEKDKFEQACREKDKRYLEQADSLLLRERLVAEKLEANVKERARLEGLKRNIESQQIDLKAAIQEYGNIRSK